MLRTRNIIAYTAAFTIFGAAALGAPFARDAMIRGTAVDQGFPRPGYAPDIEFLRKHPPLYEQCDARSPERLRLYSAG